MKANNVKSFYTEQDAATLAKYDRRLKTSLDDAGRLNELMITTKQSGDRKTFNDLVTISRTFWTNQYAKIETARDEYIRSIEQRYIESYKGNIEEILDDVREIVESVGKTEYLEYLKRRTEDLKPLLADKPGKDSSDMDRDRFRGVKALTVRGYTTFYYFLLGKIRLQINALNYYQSEEGKAQAIAIVEAKAESFYIKPKKPDPRTHLAYHGSGITPVVEVCGELLILPSSPALTLIYELLGGGDLESLPERKKKYNRNIQYNVGQGKKDQNKRQISYSKGDTTTTIEIDDYRKITNRNPQAKKILARILMNANKQAIHKGELVRDCVSFPLSDLVGEGQYKNLDTARRGFHNVGDILTSLKVRGTIERGKKKAITQGQNVVLFKATNVDNATCLVYLNELLNWALITPYYTGLPDYYFELPDRASELLEYVFYMARQNVRKITEDGYFTISYRAIQYRLNLPSEDQNRNPKRDIKDAIEAAINQINEKHRKYTPTIADGSGFSLIPMRDYEAPIKKYLDEGKLKVILGEYAERFIALNHRTAVRLEAEMERQERIEAKAVAINLAKK